MKIVSGIAVVALASTVSGWAFPLKKAKCIAKKSFLVGAAAGAVGTAIVGTAAAAGAAVAINQINNNRVVYEPASGSMNDQVVLITGGTSGLGLETAKRLSAAGATVVLTSRTQEKGEQAVENVNEYLRSLGIFENTKIFNLMLDLDDLENVKQFPESFKCLNLGDISVLINNAGVMAIPDRELTKDGYERTFQSNHLGHFILTAGLFPYLARSGAKVITVSSSAINFSPQGLDIDNLNGEKSYSAWPSYSQSKLANVLFTKELQKRADAAGENWLTAVTLHPGVVNTELWRYIVGEEKLNEMKSKGPNSLENLAMNAASLFTKTAAEGASTQIFLAAEDVTNLSKGAFYEEMKENTKLPSFASDETKAKSLWGISEEFGGITFDLTIGTIESDTDTPELVEDESQDESESIE